MNAISANDTGLPSLNRRSLLKAAPAFAVLPALAALPAIAAPTDPIITYTKRWLEAYEAWNAAAEEPDGGNFDSPACLEQERIKSEMEDLIQRTPITTDQGFYAYCQYIAADSYVTDELNQFPDMRRWQLLKIIEWSEASARIGGAA